MKIVVLNYSCDRANVCKAMLVCTNPIPGESVSKSDRKAMTESHLTRCSLLPKEQASEFELNPRWSVCKRLLVRARASLRGGVDAHHSTRLSARPTSGTQRRRPTHIGAVLTRPGPLYQGNWENTPERDRKRKGREGGQLPAVTKYAIPMANCT